MYFLRRLFLVLPLILLSMATPSQGADHWYELPVQTPLNSRLAKKKLLPGVKLFMKGQSHPMVLRKMGRYKSNKRTNTFKKTKERACGIAFLSALISLQKRAMKEGGNGVVDIYSITRNRPYRNAVNFNCLAGRAIVNVALMGTVVKLR